MKIIKCVIDKFKKKWWYFTLLLTSSFYVYVYRYSINKMDKINAVSLIFIIWMILLLMPLISEMEILGIKFKREIEKTKDELKEDIKDVRLDIMKLQISNNNNNTLNLGNDFLPSLHKLSELQENIHKNDSSQEKYNQNNNITKKVKSNKELAYYLPQKLTVSEDNIFLFKVRSYIESNLVDISSKFGYEKLLNMRDIVRFLNQRELINGKVADLLIEIIKITSRGIHGEILSKDYIEFIQDALPKIEKVFDEIHNKIEYFVCPRCRYSGYTQDTGRCPTCGYTSDEY